MDPWELLQAIRKENEELKAHNEKIQHDYDMACIELQNLRITQDGPPGLDETKEEGLVSEEAARKRLERMCKKNSQG